MKTSKNDSVKNFYEAFLCLRNTQEIRNFLIDLLTPTEREEFSRRLAVAQMLQKKVAYTEIEKATNMSSTTIARVSKFLKGSAKGYAVVLKRLNRNHHASTASPVCFDT